jgi:sortase A
LDLGPGHMPGTALPGQPGNAVISGHRTTHGAPFRNIDKLAPGDRISVETTIGTHMYEVVEVIVVAPDALWVTNQVDGAWLTLTTCNPPGSARERLIVFARLIWGPNYQTISHTMIGDEAPPQAPAG